MVDQEFQKNRESALAQQHQHHNLFLKENFLYTETLEPPFFSTESDKQDFFPDNITKERNFFPFCHASIKNIVSSPAFDDPPILEMVEIKDKLIPLCENFDFLTVSTNDEICLPLYEEFDSEFFDVHNLWQRHSSSMVTTSNFSQDSFLKHSHTSSREAFLNSSFNIDKEKNSDPQAICSLAYATKRDRNNSLFASLLDILSFFSFLQYKGDRRKKIAPIFFMFIFLVSLIVIKLVFLSTHNMTPPLLKADVAPFRIAPEKPQNSFVGHKINSVHHFIAGSLGMDRQMAQKKLIETEEDFLESLLPHSLYSFHQPR